jgi:hypothetical protein
MKRFIVFCMLLSLATVFSVGCDKKAEVKKTSTETTPGGTTTSTDSTKVETSGENPPPATK